MKKRICAVVSVVVVLFLFAVTASADVLWEPNDGFYSVSRDQCEILGRHYTTNGASGSTAVYKQPGSGAKADAIPNGSKLFVSFTYTDKQGMVWGVVQYLHDSVNDTVTTTYHYDGAVTGWIRMSDLALIYDNISFDEEHTSEFAPYQGDYASLRNTTDIILWSYPGSGEVIGTLDRIEDEFSFEHVYTDAAGRQWGYVNYYYGNRNFWVCVTDPANTQLPTNTPRPMPAPHAKEDDFVKTDKLEPRFVLAGILVLAVTAGTLFLIRIFWNNSADKRNGT